MVSPSEAESILDHWNSDKAILDEQNYFIQGIDELSLTGQLDVGIRAVSYRVLPMIYDMLECFQEAKIYNSYHSQNDYCQMYSNDFLSIYRPLHCSQKFGNLVNLCLHIFPTSFDNVLGKYLWMRNVGEMHARKRSNVQALFACNDDVFKEILSGS